MKKIILLIILLILTSCNKTIVTNVFERRYSLLQQEQAETDIYTSLKYYGLDSIPLNQWNHTIMYRDTVEIDQKFVRKIINQKSEYAFVYSLFVYPDKVYFYYLIRYSGKEKDFIP
jgi:hypothetical protein